MPGDARQGEVCLAALLYRGQVHQEGDDALPAVLGRRVDLVDQEVVVLLVALAMVVVQDLCTASHSRLSAVSACYLTSSPRGTGRAQMYTKLNRADGNRPYMCSGARVEEGTLMCRGAGSPVYTCAAP